MNKKYLELLTKKIFEEIKSSKDIINDNTDYISEYLNKTLEQNEYNKEKIIFILKTIKEERIDIDDLDPLRKQEIYDYDLVIKYISKNFIEENKKILGI